MYFFSQTDVTCNISQTMCTYFAFSDECGLYNPKKPNLKVHPYYIRSTILIKSSEWKILKEKFFALKKEYDLPINKEIKWAYLWSLRIHQKNKTAIKDNKDFKFLENYDYHKLIEFVEKTLCLLNDIEYKKIVLTVTKNKNNSQYSEPKMLKMHLQEHMQRIEMEIQDSEKNLAVLFFDPVSENTDKLLRDVYFELINEGDFIEKYSHIKDSLNIEHSHQSVGIQIADYISGAFSAMLRGITSSNYELGQKMFFEYVYPNLRRYNGKIMGAGIREVQSDTQFRNYLKTEFEKISKKYI